MVDFVALYVAVDDFWQAFEPTYRQSLLSDGKMHRDRQGRMSMSEIMTILIAYQLSNARTFKHFYLSLLASHRDSFPHMVSYSRFVWLMPRALLPLLAFLVFACMGKPTGISFIDSTAIKVCGNKRISRNRVFAGIAQMGKTTMGWFFGFKLHLVVNEVGDLLAFRLTAGNVDDREPVPWLTRELWGKLFGDKGYISQTLFEDLYQRGIKLVTGVRKNMKNKLMEVEEKVLLRKRSIIETINDQLKNVCQIEHSRHRSPANFLVHLTAALIGYTRKPTRPAIKFDRDEQRKLAQLVAA